MRPGLGPALLVAGCALVGWLGLGAGQAAAARSSAAVVPPNADAPSPVTDAPGGWGRAWRIELALAASARDAQAVERFVGLGRPLYCGGGRGRYVALTFDDGPGPYTARALRILRRAHAQATFFLVGRNVVRDPSTVRAEARLGALGDHTWTHPYLPALPPAASETQLATTQAAVDRASGARVRLFRPPYGAHDRTVDRQARRLGMLEVLWSVDTRDSEGAPWWAIAAAVRRGLRPGAIVLMHENHGQTIEALKLRILPLLRRAGYRAVTVPELLALDPPGPQQLAGRCPGSVARASAGRR